MGNCHCSGCENEMNDWAYLADIGPGKCKEACNKERKCKLSVHDDENGHCFLYDSEDSDQIYLQKSSLKAIKRFTCYSKDLSKYMPRTAPPKTPRRPPGRPPAT